MFTDTTILDKLEILFNGVIQVRKARIVTDEKGEVGRQLSRYILEPGQDVSTQPMKIQQIAAIIWTPSVVSAYQIAKAASQ